MVMKGMMVCVYPCVGGVEIICCVCDESHGLERIEEARSVLLRAISLQMHEHQDGIFFYGYFCYKYPVTVQHTPSKYSTPHQSTAESSDSDGHSV
jgi:hypothetical protein